MQNRWKPVPAGGKANHFCSCFQPAWPSPARSCPRGRLRSPRRPLVACSAPWHCRRRLNRPGQFAPSGDWRDNLAGFFLYAPDSVGSKLSGLHFQKGTLQGLRSRPKRAEQVSAFGSTQGAPPDQVREQDHGKTCLLSLEPTRKPNTLLFLLTALIPSATGGPPEPADKTTASNIEDDQVEKPGDRSACLHLFDQLGGISASQPSGKPGYLLCPFSSLSRRLGAYPRGCWTAAPQHPHAVVAASHSSGDSVPASNFLKVTPFAAAVRGPLHPHSGALHRLSAGFGHRRRDGALPDRQQLPSLPRP